jgi:RND family efflux transporter MFP subunit
VLTPLRPRFAPLALVALVPVACSQAPPEMPEAPPPGVTVSYPVERDIVDHVELTGRMAAVESVQVRARVWGHLTKINFAEGAEVRKGDLLFLIDQSPYLAALKRAEADFEQSGARSDRLKGDFARARNMVGTRSISREEFEKSSGDLQEAQAVARGAKAALDLAKLNLDYTEVRAPVSGRIGRAMVTVGNMVTSGETGGTMLTTLVSLDPMYAYFDLDEMTFLQIRRMLRWGKDGAPTRPPEVQLALAHETDFPRRGHIDFSDNQVDPTTGTLKVRGVFPNADRGLTPGLFARVRLPLGAPHKAVLVADRAIDTDQGQKVVYVVGKDDIVEKRPVRVGKMHDGLREIQDGVKAGERVVVDGIQRVRGGAPCTPRVAEMPAAKMAAKTTDAPRNGKS